MLAFVGGSLSAARTSTLAKTTRRRFRGRRNRNIARDGPATDGPAHGTAARRRVTIVAKVVTPTLRRVEIDGHPVPLDEPHRLALLPHGHFTVLQVRAGRARGLRWHLARLNEANQELYGEPLDGELVRHRIRQALYATETAAAGSEATATAATTLDATVRIVVTEQPDGAGVRVIVAIGEPATMPTTPQRLRSVPYLRPFAHLKHLGTFAQIQHGRLVRRDGYDDALLTAPGGLVAEGAMTNIGFFDGNMIVWPDAPALRGVTMTLLEQAPADGGPPSVRAPVRLADLAGRGRLRHQLTRDRARPAIDGHLFAGSEWLMTTLTRRYDAVPWDPI